MGLVGLWQPSRNPLAARLEGLLDRIRAEGMVPGLWLEIELAGIKSPLKDKPDAWFFCRHGRRGSIMAVISLDFRNPEVRGEVDDVVDRLAGRYGVGYIKMDYNVDALMGTETAADSFGQGLLEHQRAYLKWVDQVHRRWPDLVIENCGSGGGRMDYAMLYHQLQSSSDQEDYRRYPSIVAGGLAAVLPRVRRVVLPMLRGDADEASFNMVNAMLGRIHQSGHLALLSGESRREVVEGIRIYKQRIRPHLTQMVPFLPLGLPAMADTRFAGRGGTARAGPGPAGGLAAFGGRHGEIAQTGGAARRAALSDGSRYPGYDHRGSNRGSLPSAGDGCPRGSASVAAPGAFRSRGFVRSHIATGDGPLFAVSVPSRTGRPPSAAALHTRTPRGTYVRGDCGTVQGVV